MKKQRKMIKCLVALATATACTFCFIPTSSAEAISVSQQYIHQNRSHQYLQPRGLVIHDTDAPGGSAQNNHDYFNRVYAGASAHYFVGWDKTIQAIPENEVAWHAGYTANHRFLSIEMCEPNGNQAQFNKVYWDTVDLAANICKRHGWSTNQIYSHRYCSWTWKQTDHEDPYAYLKKFGKSWDDLMKDIQNRINEGGGSVTTSSNNNSNVTEDKNYKGTDTNATVKVSSCLNVRETPNGRIIGQLRNGERVKVNTSCSTGNWYSIYYGAKGGFISKDYVSMDKPAKPATTGFVVTQYLPNGWNGNGKFKGVDINYVLKYFKDVKCVVKGNDKGVWIETQQLPLSKCYQLQKELGSWFYGIEGRK